MKNFIVTIDGPAGSGKSTMARLLAKKLSFTYLDTGAMYRALTYAAVNQKKNILDSSQLINLLQQNHFSFSDELLDMKVKLNGNDITNKIRTPELTEKVKHIADDPAVREKLVKMQRNFAQKHKNLITEGRDQGTVVFPNAQLKFYLTADINQRALRRKKQLSEKNSQINLSKLVDQISQRDRADQTRKVAPLKKAPDAVTIDTTQMSVEQVVDKMAQIIKAKKADK
jgi:cytidylate kinase